MKTVYTDIGKCYKKFNIEKHGNLTYIDVMILGIFRWLQINYYDSDLTVSY